MIDQSNSTRTRWNEWPPGAYMAVRKRGESWVAIIGLRGAVLSAVECESRREAFDLACTYAEQRGLECLVTRGPQ